MSSSRFDDRRKVFALVHLGSAFTLALFVAVHLSTPCCYALSSVEGMLLVVMLASYLAIRRGVPLARVENALMASAVMLFSSLILFESIHDTGVFWIAGFPFVAYFVLRVRRARFWVAFFAVEILLAALLQSLYFFQTPYSVTQLLCLDAVILFFWMFAHIYQSQLESRQAQLADSYRALAQEQGRLHAILDHSPIGIWMLDTHRHLQFLNRAWVQWSGVTEQTALAEVDYSTLIPDTFAAHALSSDRECLSGESPHYSREEIDDGHGGVKTVDMIRVRLSDSRGSATGLVGFAIDVTRQVQAEAERYELEQQMQHAQRLESLGVMAGGIAHDFNNLLTAIHGSVELLQLEREVSDAVRSSVNCIDAASTAAIELCQQMLAYSGKGLRRSEVIAVDEMVEGMMPLLEATVGKHVKLACRLDGGCTIEADRAQFRQLLLNLVSNASEAIDSSRSGRIDITAEIRPYSDDAKRHTFFGEKPERGSHVVLRVEDNGSGMDQHTLEHMFEPFYTTKFTGRGLGLSAIQGVLNASHAAIAVKSEAGRGTSIEIWFPATDEAVAPSAQPDAGQRENRALCGRVLLVDDEPGVIHVASRMLARVGLSVETAVNGREAVALFAADPGFDWVLLDVTMPEMDGNACLKAMRKIRPDIYVVMTSGYDAKSALVRDGHCQPNDFLTKPFTFDALCDAAERAAGGAA